MTMARPRRIVTPPRGKIVKVDGLPARIVDVPRPQVEGGDYRMTRYVAPPGMSLKVARENGLDFYHPKYGWLRGGYKFEVDRPLTPQEVQGLSDTVVEDYNLDELEDFTGFTVGGDD